MRGLILPRLCKNIKGTNEEKVAKYLEKLAAARALLRSSRIDTEHKAYAPLGHPDVDTALGGGLLTGGLHEIFAATPGASAAAGGFAAALTLRTAPRARKLLWIRQDFSALEHGEISGSGLVEIGLDPRRLLMLRAANAADALRAAADALSCAALGAAVIEIIGAPKILDLVASRKLVLAAQMRGVSAFLLRLGGEPQPSAAQTRWIVKSAPSENNDDWGHPRFDVTLARNRHGQTGHWDMEWDCDNGFFCAPQKRAAHSGAVVSAPANRSAAA
jgi:protein ImuA